MGASDFWTSESGASNHKALFLLLIPSLKAPFVTVTFATPLMLSKSQKIKKRGNLANTEMPQIVPGGQSQLLVRDGV